MGLNSEKHLCANRSRSIQAMTNWLGAITITGMLIAPLKVFAGGELKTAIGPTVENALAADKELAKAMQDNDTTGILRLLDKDWAVIPTTGGVAEGPDIFPSGIKSGYLVRKTFSISEPRVRLYGTVAIVTTKVELSGVFQGKGFAVTERQTDVWHWTDGRWKCVLTHETKIPNN